MPPVHTFQIADDQLPTVLTALRKCLPEKTSWSEVRKLLRGRLVAIGGVLCVDEGRRLTIGEELSVWGRPFPIPPQEKDVSIKFVDDDLIVVEKPSGMETLRRKSDLGWSWARKNQQPTLDECVPRLMSQHAARRKKTKSKTQRLPRLYPVHRLDRDSSGLIVFARNTKAQTGLIGQFADHAAVRKYLALIPGRIRDQTVNSFLIRDRGDGLRGSTTDQGVGKQAVSHFHHLDEIGPYSELECVLETGRTNQIRIHLAELGNPICGDIKYRGPFGVPAIEDQSKARRLALHAAELKIVQPTTGKPLVFKAQWPPDMIHFLSRLRSL